MTTPKRTVLVTGAAGRIATVFRKDAGKRYALRLVDRDVSSLVGISEAEVRQVDLAEPTACQTACAGMDTVLHLAADSSPTAGFYESLLDANIKATYNVFRAAKDQGCRRVVFASSAQAVEGYPLDVQVAADAPVRPKNLYGVTKCFGEALASYFATEEGLSAVAVRIGAFETFAPGERHTARDMSAYASHRDVISLLVRCIEARDIGFAVVHAISDNRFKRLDLSTTRALLGYAPQDDAFQILDLQLHD